MHYTPDLQPAVARLMLNYVIPVGILTVAAIVAYIIPAIGRSFSDTKMLEQSGLKVLIYMRYVFIAILSAVVIFAIWFAVKMFTEKVVVTNNIITKRHFFRSKSMAVADISTAEITDNTNIYAVDANRTAGSIAGHLLGCAHRITFTDSHGKKLVIEPVNKKMAAIFLQQIEQFKTQQQ